MARESEWTWEDGTLYGTYMDGIYKAKAEINCEKGYSYSFTGDRDNIAKYLKDGVFN